MLYLLLGGSGILGSGFREAIRRRSPDARLVRSSPDWTRPEAAGRHLAVEVVALPPAEPVTVIWAAGVGQVGTPVEVMAAERIGLEALCGALTGLPHHRQRRIRLIFASSAGALFGGNDGTQVFDETSDPTPVSAYGHEKLRQEAICRSIAAPDGIGVLICRYSNLYGLASGRMPGKGLIPAAIRAARLRQAMTIYVPPDTRRDYVYGPDAAATSLVLADDLTGGTTTALVAQGVTSTVAEIVTTVGAIVGRRVPATYAVRLESALQPRSLRFVPRTCPTAVRTPMSVAIHRMVHTPSA